MRTSRPLVGITVATTARELQDARRISTTVRKDICLQ